mmetsp:Transcript_13952/g.16163  ORF Transcript_13952/g.16163 Transcript_13952/m.16163 type:complete len:160 (+) Transcript_13952:457-936(+)
MEMSKTPITRSRLTTQISFTKTVDQEIKESRRKISLKSGIYKKMLKPSVKIDFNRMRVRKNKLQFIFDKNGFSTIRVNNNNSTVDVCSSISPNSNIILSNKTIHRGNNLKIDTITPNKPGLLSFNSQTLIRERGMEEIKEYPTSLKARFNINSSKLIKN